MSSQPERYSILSMETASVDAKPLLESVQKTIGKVPNMIGTMANAPLTLRSYTQLGANVREAGFGPLEQHVIYLTISVENECDYCVAAHSTALKKAQKVDPAIVAAIRSGEQTGDQQLDPLINVVREIVTQKGRVSQAAHDAFISAGYSKRQLIDLLSAVAMKTLINYLDHLTDIKLDDAYVPEAP